MKAKLEDEPAFSQRMLENHLSQTTISQPPANRRATGNMDTRRQIGGAHILIRLWTRKFLYPPVKGAWVSLAQA